MRLALHAHAKAKAKRKAEEVEKKLAEHTKLLEAGAAPSASIGGSVDGVRRRLASCTGQKETEKFREQAPTQPASRAEGQGGLGLRGPERRRSRVCLDVYNTPAEACRKLADLRDKAQGRLTGRDDAFAICSTGEHQEAGLLEAAEGQGGRRQASATCHHDDL